MAVTKILKALAKARKTQADNIKKKDAKALKKNPTTETERAAKKKHHHAASVKALAKQQAKIKELAMEEGMKVKAYKEKFADSPPMKKLVELQKQNTIIKDKDFSRGGSVTDYRKGGMVLSTVDNRRNK
tara:strand:- start:37 stop:423 length:387 start_codon:yes stop_codon:yes gene_type:complete